MIRAALASVLIAAWLLLAACGSGDSASSPPASPGVGASPPASAAGTGRPASSASSAATESNVAGDIPDTQAFVATAGPGSRFRVNVPEGWARREQGGVVTFTSNFNSIRLEVLPAASAPTVDSATSTEVPQVMSAGAGVSGARVISVSRSAGTAVLITYQADSPTDPVTGKVVRLDVERYEFWRSGSEAVLTLSAAAGSDNVDPWRKVTDSFQWS